MHQNNTPLVQRKQTIKDKNSYCPSSTEPLTLTWLWTGVEDPLPSSRDRHGLSIRTWAAKRTEVLYLQVTHSDLPVHCWVVTLSAPTKKSKARDRSIKRPAHPESTDLNPSQQEKTSFSVTPYFSLFSMCQVNFFLITLISRWIWARYVSLLPMDLYICTYSSLSTGRGKTVSIPAIKKHQTAKTLFF